MATPADAARDDGPRTQSQTVVIHWRGSRMFSGRSRESTARVLTVEEVEGLTSAGFEIVEVNSREGAPLCASLAATTRS
jgi:hypothetical protein